MDFGTRNLVAASFGALRASGKVVLQILVEVLGVVPELGFGLLASSYTRLALLSQQTCLM